MSFPTSFSSLKDAQSFFLKNGMLSSADTELGRDQVKQNIMFLCEAYNIKIESESNAVNADKNVNEMHSNSQRSSFDIMPPKINALKTDFQIMNEEGIDESKLYERRKELVKPMRIDEQGNVRYEVKLHEIYNKIKNVEKPVFHVAVILHSGKRIYKIFGEQSKMDEIYIWCAVDDALIKEDKIKLGSFVILTINGKELSPDTFIKDIVDKNRIILFLRLIC